MPLLLVVALLAGVVTAISPCIIPVLPVIVAGGSTSTNRRQPYAVVAGLVASFAFFILVSRWLLSLLHLPIDLFEYIGASLLLLLAVGLVVPKIGELLERPFARLGTERTVQSAGGFILGASLGPVFLPCAGPVLAAISTAGTKHLINLSSIVVTVVFAVGMGVPLLILTVVARRTTTGWKALRGHLPAVRKIAGVAMGVVAIALLLTFAGAFTLTHVFSDTPNYIQSIEHWLETGTTVKKQLLTISGEKPNKFAEKQAKAPRTDPLPDLGRAPTFVGITQWLNTPGDRPLKLSALGGKVVLVDFWTYSCINCQRSLPHVEAWYARYHKYGLDVIGVQSPEFPFEHVVSNVEGAAARLGVKYPIAIDNTLKTWTAYDNEYWPAEYLIDQDGIVRHTDFGEGGYTTTERDIRLLLTLGGVDKLPPPTQVANRTPNEPLTPETYLGAERFATTITRYVGSPAVRATRTEYTLAKTVSTDSISLGGTWTQESWWLTAGKGATIELGYMANDVYLVLGGTGTVEVSVNGKYQDTVHVSGIPDLYTMISSGQYGSGLLTLRFSPGVEAYDFTFG